MRRVIYGCAMSLDGYVAGPNGEYDWIVTDPSIDFVARMAKFDALLVGRKTFDAMMKAGRPTMLGIKTFVFSRTLKPSDDADVSIYADAERVVAELRTKSGKDIALFGGGQLFRSLLAAGQVDRIEISVIPVLLGGGIPLLPPPADRTTLCLREQRVYHKTGTVALEYDVNP